MFRVPGPLRYYIIDVMKQCCFYVAKFKIRKLKISRIFICTLTEKREFFFEGTNAVKTGYLFSQI